ncbi:exodeoxyribonuclease V alpha subunit [Cohaesibacter marisflavi]|uniref:Exodeoxyribonuclease V alpha subunit n=1 Tax=Cohaesibacter marisflavi TaxID=655353 RepID=A0A1I5MJL8_9HYPH|nr:AAA family ATPase [Cohaesibacter marisflavi]SFP09794.1 exodeoxyribonuclease V alpha subunit [Cohaesibacter marisflavi]
MKIQISNVRRNGFLSARELNSDGTYVQRDRNLCCVFPNTFSGAVLPGSIWQVDGPIVENRINVSGKIFVEDLMKCEIVELEMISTNLLQIWLSKNIKKVGPQRARRFANYPDFIALAQSADTNELLKIPTMTAEMAQEIIVKFPSEDQIETINWFSQKSIPFKVAYRMWEVMGPDAISYVQQNPFDLTKFGVRFKVCFSLAEDLGFASDSEIVLAAKAADVVNHICATTGSTAVSHDKFNTECARRGYNTPTKLLNAAGAQRSLGLIDGKVITELNYIVENEVANILKSSAQRIDGEGHNLADWEIGLSDRKIILQIDSYQRRIPYKLTQNQRGTILGAIRSKVALISGGAGTGKTTILKGIIHILDRISPGINITQLALSGRASQRMAEATGRPASTIAKFITDIRNMAEEKRPQHCVVIIDEASMVDIYSMHKLLSLMHPSTRYLLVGDDQQLPPVGGGLVFHALLDSEVFPTFNLMTVQRQSQDSLIHQFATAIRNNSYYHLPHSRNPCGIDCAISPTDRIIEIWEHDSYDTMILCPTRNGPVGVRKLNQDIQSRVGNNRPAIPYFDQEEGMIEFVSSEGSRFRLDDPILITKNSYDIDVRNGEIGRLVAIFDEPNEDGAFGILLLNNRQLSVDLSLLQKMELAYAVSIHKSQGSQWRNTIVAIDHTSDRMLDKTLLYTAVTRATHRCVLACDDEQILHQAATGGSKALNRDVALRFFL